MREAVAAVAVVDIVLLRDYWQCAGRYKEKNYAAIAVL